MSLTMTDAELLMLPIGGEGAIIVDPTIQQRVAMDREKVEEYAALYADGHDLGRLVVFQVGEQWILADGFHRVDAAGMAGLTTLPCEVYRGTRRDAILYATSCNLHGKPLSNADKRQRVQTLLADPEWAQWSDNSIAKHCGVAQSFVGTVRKSLITVISEDTTSPSLNSEISDDGMDTSLNSEISDNGTSPTRRTYRDRYGQVRTMETSAIGHQPSPKALVLEPEVPAPPAPPKMQQQAWTLVYIDELGRCLTHALQSLDRLHAHLTSQQSEELVVQLPDFLEHQAALGIKLGECWGHVETLLLRSATVRQGLGRLSPAPAPDATLPPLGDGADPDCPAFDTAKFVLGKLCKGGHEHGKTGQSLLRRSGRYCGLCNAALKRQQRRQPAGEVPA
jgi:hypothetical protein